MNEINQSSFFERVGAKASFWLGITGGVGAFFVIGFFVLLTLYFKGGITLAQADNRPSIVQPTDSGPTAPTEIKIELDKKDWYRGDKNAKVTLVEFSDTECPFCKRFHENMLQLMTEYKGKVKWVYRHFPLTQLHQYAQKEAEALECVGDLGGNDAFNKMLDNIMKTTQSNDGLPPEKLPELAAQSGVNRAKFETCLSSGKFAGKVQEHASQAVAAGGSGTPYSVILSGDTKIPVNGALPLAQLKSIIDPLLK